MAGAGPSRADGAIIPAMSRRGSRLFDRAGPPSGLSAVEKLKGVLAHHPAPAPPPNAAPAEPVGTVITRGKLIRLRSFVPGDLEYLGEWAEDPHLDRMVGSEFLQAFKDVYEKDPSFYDAVLMDATQIVAMVIANEDDRVVGVVRLFNIHQSEGYAGIETIIGDARASRRGFGVQASRLMAYYGVDALGLRRIEAKAYEYNPLSINTLLRNGFKHEGTLRQASYRDGRYWDILVFGLLKDELEEQRRKDKYLLAPSGEERVSEPS
jgi:RimJ/RimL family protein N-acetyltransferase